MSQEYIAAIVIILVSLLKVFGIEIGSDVITGIVTGVLALWVAIKRHARGDITPLGVRK